MPFGGDFDDYYKQIYKPAIESIGLIAQRADDLYRPSTIISDIWEMINKAKILIADLSTLNGNVMYELGLAHAIAKPVILISDSIDTIPFDLRGLRILTYNKNKPDWSSKLYNDLISSITETVSAPLESILPTFLNVRQTQHVEVNQITSHLLEIKQLLHQQNISNPYSEDMVTNKSLTGKELSDAIEEAKKLYYDSGYEIGEIRQHIANKYGISYEKASKIFGKSII
jgi:hypothetical protein